MEIIAETGRKVLRAGEIEMVCALGKNGVIAGEGGREGDGKTPLGRYVLRFGLYRSDRIELPQTGLIFHPLNTDDGWCDDPNDLAYNRFVRLPYRVRSENLWRESGVYDIIIVLGHNDAPPVSGLGSAIFLHIAREGYGPTQGCIAISQTDMLRLIPMLGQKDTINITS